MSTKRRRYESTEEEWNKIKHYFTNNEKRQAGRPMNDILGAVNGIIWLARSGAPWCDLPERYGNWNTVYKAFVRWEKAGLFERIFHDLAIDADLQDVSIDSTTCKAHQHSAGAKKGH